MRGFLRSSTQRSKTSSIRTTRLNINSVRSNTTVSLADFGFEISPPQGMKYNVWIDYDGVAKHLTVHMARGENSSKPDSPILNQTINLKHFLNKNSFIGFSGSTGHPQIQLNCVLKWSLQIDIIPSAPSSTALIIPAIAIAAAFGLIVLAFYRRKLNRSSEENVPERVRRMPGMPREFRYK